MGACSNSSADPQSPTIPRLTVSDCLHAADGHQLWRATTASGRRCAVKLWPSAIAPGDRDRLLAFHRQGKLLSSLRSPHTVRVLGHGISKQRQPYLLLAKAPKETLDAWLERAVAMPLRDVTNLVSQLTEAVAEIHRLGRVHGELDGHRVEVVRVVDFAVRLTDFGVHIRDRSGSFEAPTQRDAAANLEAAAPERSVVGPCLTPSADIWSIAVLAYRALTGRSPFATRGYVATRRAMLSGDYRPPSASLGPEEAACGRALDGWFARCFAVDPNARFQSTAAQWDAWCAATGMAGDASEDDEVTHPLDGEEIESTPQVRRRRRGLGKTGTLRMEMAPVEAALVDGLEDTEVSQDNTEVSQLTGLHRLLASMVDDHPIADDPIEPTADDRVADRPALSYRRAVPDGPRLLSEAELERLVDARLQRALMAERRRLNRHHLAWLTAVVGVFLVALVAGGTMALVW